ncbi:MAG TPA: PorP/SprF family type IX secretion system membrane protein [Chitinophagales bacterium]
MKKRLLGFFLLCMVVGASAQDIHYSQFFNSPLTLNPALTGLTKGRVRVGAIYRNQWFSGINNGSSGFGNSPYQTPSVFVDAPIKIKEYDIVGVGGMFLYDKAGAGSLGTFQIIASGSYIKSLGVKHNHQLSVGLQIGWTQLKISQADLQFANQFDQNNQFQGSIASNVGLKPNTNYANINIGLLYYGRFSKMLSMYVGGAFYNAASMKYNLEANNEKRDLYYRGNAQVGFDVAFGKYHILPSVLFMQQSTADQLNIGLGFGYDFSEKTTLTLGLYVRGNDITNKYNQADAVIPYFAAEFTSYKIAVSYDATVSKFKAAGAGVGALEISFIYTLMQKGKLPLNNFLYCPRY